MKKIVSIVLVVFVIAACVLMFVNNKNEARYNSQMAEISNVLAKYKAERIEIEKDIEAAWVEYEDVLSGGNTCFTLFIDNITENVMDSAYPLISSYGYKATVIMDGLRIPGDEDCISENDYATLTDAGWDFAIGTASLDLTGKDKLEVLEEYIVKYSEKLKKAGLGVPETICFGKGQYSTDYTDIILKNGFKVARYYPDTNEIFSHGVKRNGLYLLTTIDVSTNSVTVRKNMDKAYTDLYTYSVSVRYITQSGREEDRTRDCHKEKYENMLSYAEKNLSEANIFTATELYEYKTKVLAEEDGFLDDFNKRMSELEKKLKAVDDKIAEQMKILNDM